MPLAYPFDQVPGTSEVLEIVPGVKWVRSPLPISLNHINCYLLQEGDAWCIVDTGMNSALAREQWQAILQIVAGEQNKGAPRITRIIGTHHHPDHIGLAGWLCDEYRAPLFMSEREYLFMRTYSQPKLRTDYWETQQFFTRTGMSEASCKELFAHDDFTHMVSDPPTAYHRLRNGMSLQIGEHRWQVITTRGHAPEHVSLYCEALQLLLAGDQVLPKITPNLNVGPTDPDDDPLAYWFDGHQKLRDRVPDSVLVLPSHQRPFYGLHARIEAIIRHHHERLDAIVALIEAPLSVQQITRQLFDRELNVFQNFLAVGEVLAHLRYLENLGFVERKQVADTWQFQRTPYYTPFLVQMN
ncbi:Beta-lactamase-like protein [gamma proteobacterium HdN1]|nr:Beta-lactamase-like protein [gamma proteobacterium HdN1]